MIPKRQITASKKPVSKVIVRRGIPGIARWPPPRLSVTDMRDRSAPSARRIILTMDTSERREFIDRFIAAYNAFDIDGMLAVLSADVRFENYSSGSLTAATTGLDEFRQLAEQSKAMFSEREQQIMAIEFHGQVATATIAYRGRLAVDVPDGPTAGTIVELTGSSEYSFAGGRITKIVDRS